MKKIKVLFIDPRFNRVEEKEVKIKNGIADTMACCIGTGLPRAVGDVRLEPHNSAHMLLCSEEKQQNKNGPYFVLLSEYFEKYTEERFLRIYGKAVLFKWDTEKHILQDADMGKDSILRSISYKPMELRKVKELEVKVEQLEDLYAKMCRDGAEANLKLMTKHSLEALYWALGKAEELPVVEKYEKAEAKRLAELKRKQELEILEKPKTFRAKEQRNEQTRV